MSEQLMAKLVPFSRSTGHKVKRYNFRGTMFLNDNKWRLVSDDLAASLRQLRSNPNDPTSLLAFLVMNESDARQWEQDQRRKVDDDIEIVGGGGLETRHPDEVRGGDPVVQRALDELRKKSAKQAADLKAERAEKARLQGRLDAAVTEARPELVPEPEKLKVVDLAASKPAPKPAPKKKAPPKQRGTAKKRGGKK